MNSTHPSLSVCMIVRDEEKMLPACLASLQGLADELIIVDTGSSDRTPEIAIEAGATLIRHDWRDDFAEARNASLGAAHGEWVVWLDADERLRPRERELLRRTIAHADAQIFEVPVCSPTHDGGHTIYGHRLFRNGLGIRFSGRVHEQVTPSFSGRGLKVGRAAFTIDHLGYALSKERLAEKHDRNLRLLLKACDEHPRDAYVRFTLAQNHMIAGRREEAERELNIALGRDARSPITRPLPPDIRAAAWNNMAQCALERGDAQSALICARESLLSGHRQITAHLMAYRAQRALGVHSDALRELQEASRILAEGAMGDTAIEVSINPVELCRAMGHCCLDLGRYAEAKDHFAEALRNGERHPRTLAAMARALLECGAHCEALAHVEEALKLSPDQDESLLELAALILMKLGQFEEAAAHLGILLMGRPNDMVLRRRLAGCLVKAGRAPDARCLLAAAVAHEAENSPSRAKAETTVADHCVTTTI